MSHKIVVIEGGKRVEQVAQKPVENTEWMLGWCRKWITCNGVPIFAQMQDAALASKGKPK